MAIFQLNDTADIRAPKPWDERVGFWNDTNNGWDIFATRQDALDALSYRYIGQTVPVRVGNFILEYWFVGGLADVNFIQKTPNDIGVEIAELDPDNPLPSPSLAKNNLIYYQYSVDGIRVFVSEATSPNSYVWVDKGVIPYYGGGGGGVSVILNNFVSYGDTTSTWLDINYPSANRGDIVWSETNSVQFTKLDTGKWSVQNIEIA